MPREGLLIGWFLSLSQRGSLGEQQNVIQVLDDNHFCGVEARVVLAQLFWGQGEAPRPSKQALSKDLERTYRCSVDLVVKVSQAAVLTPPFLFLHRRRVVVVKTLRIHTALTFAQPPPPPCGDMWVCQVMIAIKRIAQATACTANKRSTLITDRKCPVPGVCRQSLHDKRNGRASEPAYM